MENHGYLSSKVRRASDRQAGHSPSLEHKSHFHRLRGFLCFVLRENLTM